MSGRTALMCAKCMEVQVGHHYEYSWGPSGQDPPENFLYNEEFVDENDNGICEDCYNTLKDQQEEEEVEDESSIQTD